MKVSCCILFNHPYPKNIPILREIYKDRFDEILFIQPFLESEDSDVITSYRGSYNFNGMIVDASQALLNSNSDYFVFIHDDVVLNPIYSGSELVDRLDVPGNGAFLPSIFPLRPDVQDWVWVTGFLWKLYYPLNVMSGTGILDIVKYFPDAQIAKRSMEDKYGFVFNEIIYDRLADIKQSALVSNELHANYIAKSILDGLYVTSPGSNRIELPFPFIGGNCDFVVLDRKALQSSIPMLGITAAANLFVEIAMPTSIACNVNRIVTSSDVGLYSLMTWTDEEQRLVNDEEIIDRFSNDLLLLHPVKLSREKDRFEKIIARTRAQNR